MEKRKWEELDIQLSNPVLKTLKQLKFVNMTPVQVMYI
jgi:superfamily II DNA/RNA helicase